MTATVKNLLVTGGCGFIGSNFINYYFKFNESVNIINIDALYYSGNCSNIDEKVRDSSRYKFIHANICSSDMVKHVLNEYSIDTVIHFAAQSHVDSSFEKSLQYTKDNILGTHILLEECRKYNKLSRFIHISTDEVYGETNMDQKSEESVLCPTNPYAATKAAAELLVQAYYHSFKMPVIITRSNNVYGINQHHEKLIPKFIKLLSENKKVTIQGDGTHKRGFLFAEDFCTAISCILNKGLVGEIYNIGCDDETQEYTVMEIAQILIKMLKNTEDYQQWIEYIEDRPFNDKRYFISNKKLRNIGWNIKWSLDQGLRLLLSTAAADKTQKV